MKIISKNLIFNEFLKPKLPYVNLKAVSIDVLSNNSDKVDEITRFRLIHVMCFIPPAYARWLIHVVHIIHVTRSHMMIHSNHCLSAPSQPVGVSDKEGEYLSCQIHGDSDAVTRREDEYEHPYVVSDKNDDGLSFNKSDRCPPLQYHSADKGLKASSSPPLPTSAMEPTTSSQISKYLTKFTFPHTTLS